MGRNGVKVIIRARPTAVFAQNQIHIDQDENTIEISLADTKVEMVPSNKKDSWKFKFHQVLQNAGQDKVYEAIARDIVHGTIVDGINGTIMAYGQTGAGKTFTMIGDTRNYQHRGIAPRAIAQVFQEMENRIEIESTVHVSYMEIYNDRIFDLLAPEDDTDIHEYVIVEDAKGTYVRGLTQVETATEKDALDQLFNGELRRTVAEHQLNKRSNRSHCIFTFHISQKSRTGGNEHVVHSKLHLVDLAGSERLKKTMQDDEGGAAAHKTTIKKESMYINQSLTFLEQCIVALGAREQRHIPYRQTKLTNVLKDSLGGNCNTLMFACVWGESKHLEETISTLKLAQRMMRVQNEATSIVETDPTILIKKYEKQIKELKQELTMHDALVERTGVIYDEHTPEQKFELMRMVRAYVDSAADDDAVLQLTSLRHIKELFRQFKVLLKNAESASPQPFVTRSSTSNVSRENGTLDGSTLDDDDKLVGDPEDHAGFVLGQAPSGAMPAVMDVGAKKDGGFRADDSTIRDASPVDVADEKNEAKGDPIEVDKDDAYKFFITAGPGKKMHVSLQDEKQTLKTAKDRARDVTSQLNATKVLIDDLTRQIQDKRAARKLASVGKQTKDDDEEVVDEEEFLLMRKEREAKRDYRVLYDDLKEAKSEYDFTQRSIELLRMRLVQEFEEWYQEGGSQAKDGEDGDRDKLDEGEKFDQMEVERIRAQDPDSLAFFQAQKKMRQGGATSQRKAAKR